MRSGTLTKFLYIVSYLFLGLPYFVFLGGWGPLDSDWLKHNAILRDLITESWPVIYDVSGHKIMLTYYTAYQLPAAVVGKLLGWQAANHVLFAYTTIGFCLSALWVWVLTGGGRWWIIMIFLAFSGMDFIGRIISTIYREPTLSDAVSAFVEHVGSYRQIWCMPLKSSGDLVRLFDPFSVNELHAFHDLRQVREAA